MNDRNDLNRWTKFFSKYFTFIFLGYGILSIYFLCVIETTENGGFKESVLWTAFPLMGFFFGIIYVYQEQIIQAYKDFHQGSWFERRLKGPTTRGSLWVLSIMAYLILQLWTWPYFLVMNSLVVKNDVVKYEGVVIDKHQTHGRYKSNVITVHEKKLNSDIEFSISDKDYRNVKIGSPFYKAMYMGRFGIPFRWRISWAAKINDWLTAKNSSSTE